MYDTTLIQTRLKELGFDPGPIDGLMGPRTEKAIVSFKRSIGFRPRPYVGPLTFEALVEDAPITTLPWMSEAVRIKGLHEQRDTSKLKHWFDKSVSWIDPREIPWCGAYVATVFRKWNPDITLPVNPLGARNWNAFGTPCQDQLGCVLVFSRPGSSWAGHVGFYWGEDEDAYHVLGGNQSNAVTVARVSKDRLLGARWPLKEPQPKTRVWLSKSGRISMNEG